MDKAAVAIDYFWFYERFVDLYLDKYGLDRNEFCNFEALDKIPDYISRTIECSVETTDEAIRNQIMAQAESFIKEVINLRNNASSPYHLDGYSVNKALTDINGRSIAEKKFPSWSKALDVYNLYYKEGVTNKSEVSRRMGWFDKSSTGDCIKEVSEYLDLANRLVEAVGSGTFATEANKPFKKKKIKS